ncbi:hypothetical protein ACIQNU_31120 [Streptomyces sp. NPDC091292]|uniref:hypothetical protein n=1 Tax=Streptomyces sp. NPDC091292 TaxID=3365991 RepID=UPI0038206123
MSKTQRAGAGLAAVCGLLAVTAPQAHAEVEPGGWTSESPSFTTQERGCGTISGLTFSLSCGDTSGEQRAERRYATYTGGTHQFEGSFRISSMGGSRISLKQTFRDTSGSQGPFFMLAVERGGRLYSVEGGATLSPNAGTVGATVRVNTVNQVGKTHRTYINGSLVNAVSSASGSYYDKFGAYRTNSGNGPVTVSWSNVKFWRK